jgi:hypothetical protein
VKAIAGAILLYTAYVHGYGFNMTTGHAWMTGALVGLGFTLIIAEVVSSS